MSGIIYEPPVSRPGHICKPPQPKYSSRCSSEGGSVIETWKIDHLVIRTGTVWQCGDCGTVFVWGPRGVRPDWWSAAELRRPRYVRRALGTEAGQTMLDAIRAVSQ